ncbi:transporter associated domain-containing protein [Treponema pallidum]|uniref:Hemolysin, putative n=2 Tax=Treponema pallidum subsp. pallidum TaxID=161 RepID=O83906_TREPA|nr:hemolysin family protein [Treponema pallidum]ADD73025.1 hemolysin, putative [Treponema pallidum subsp. pallidum str. Chicago]AFU66911.1 putative hemolysin [Treponema pallidum subsp. pallidum str. Mexico A]AAC65893.1 hemolysin, putative [Treponema pallidum subsp. pallidum str. Nichols]ACD71352.1 possible hemolysin [Treponema pallidum subsp. pallidum SS14]AEZ61269.1 putative hemolysin [Treponema pallidum subsp. pallidum DAL-1]
MEKCESQPYEIFITIGFVGQRMKWDWAANIFSLLMGKSWQRQRARASMLQMSYADCAVCFDQGIGSYMVHRTDIVWVEARALPSHIFSMISQHDDYNYFPVCARTIDAVVGYFSVQRYVRVCLEMERSAGASREQDEQESVASALHVHMEGRRHAHAKGQGVWIADPVIARIVQQPIFVPEVISVRKLLHLFQQMQAQMAFVIDEYGGIEGMVTRDELIMRCVQEYARADGINSEDCFQNPDGSWIVSGWMNLNEMYRLGVLARTTRPHTGVHTIAGYVLSIRNRIPRVKEQLNANGCRFTILKMDGRRIDRLLVEREHPVPSTSGEVPSKGGGKETGDPLSSPRFAKNRKNGPGLK